MADEPDPVLDIATRMVREVPHAAALGLEMVERRADGGVMRAPYREDLVGDPQTGVLAGGVITALLDHACGFAVGASVLGDTAMGQDGLRESGTATLDLRIDYMRPARPRRDVLAHAYCYKVTHLIAFVRGVAYEDDPDDPIATAQAAFVLAGARPRPAD